MTPSIDQAHGMACELRDKLGDLFDLLQHGPGSSIEAAWDGLDAVIEYLELAQWGLPPSSLNGLMAGGKR